MGSKHIRMPFGVTILSLFLSLFVGVVAVIIWYNYTKNSEVALTAAEQTLIEVSDKVIERNSLHFLPVTLTGNMFASMPQTWQKPVSLEHPNRALFLSLLERIPQIYSFYMGFEDGDFYQVISLNGVSDDSRRNMEAPQAARFAVRQITLLPSGERVEEWHFLDLAYNLISRRLIVKPTYDPRSRPWYRKAMETDGSIKTDLYVFASLRAPGLTIARRFPLAAGAGGGVTGGVFGVDLTLTNLSHFLASQRPSPNALAFLFTEDGRFSAFPDAGRTVVAVEENGTPKVMPARLESSDYPMVRGFWQAFAANRVSGEGPQEETARFVRFEVGEALYLARIAPLGGFAGATADHLAVVAPISDFTAPIQRIQHQTLLFSLVALLLAVPVIALIARRMSRPLQALVEEANTIRRFDLEESIAVTSRVREIGQLSQAMDTMKSALRTFGQYVPKDLVRQLIQTETVAELGGERRHLTLLFTDIANFTTITESQDADSLMRSTSEYFAALGDEIHDGKGTIDKFIGDAVMAFWNAPQPDPDHAAHACRTALLCRNRSNALNAAWKASGRPVMHTRFGLHSGEVVVGNVGSSDRMSYTAMGAAVNLASRVEGLNKFYGTQILVSQTVYTACSERFVFRFVDWVQPKGTLTPVAIYELVGGQPEVWHDDADLWVDAAMRRYCEAWNAASALYQARQWSQAQAAFAALSSPVEDPLLQLYRVRTGQFVQEPPPEDWSGVVAYTLK